MDVSVSKEHNIAIFVLMRMEPVLCTTIFDVRIVSDRSSDGVIILDQCQQKLGSGVAQWLRYCASNREVLGSIPSGAAGDFFPMLTTEPCALGLTQPLKMSTRILLVVKPAGA
jgi:hypothetical protein